MDEPVVLSRELESFAAQVATLDAASCSPLLEAYFVRLEGLEPDRVDLGDVRENALASSNLAFRTRVAVHAHQRRLAREGTLTPACGQAIRRYDTATRYLIDHLFEAIPPGGQPPEWLVNPEVSFSGVADLRNGDLLVTRAKLISSAGIAHMGRIDSQFSHNALVHLDPETGEGWVVEAYLESGALVEPLAEFLEHGLGRIVVLRHEDAELAGRAADAAFERVRRGKRIPYDSRFDVADGESLFCSEVPGWAFGTLLGGPVTIPSDPTVFEKAKNPKLYAAMGIAVDVTSAPADVLYDPHFELVAEWRDATAIDLLRRHDAVVESAMRWMEEEDYVLEIGPKERTTVAVGKFVRGIPLLGLSLRKTLSPGLDRDFLAASLALQAGATTLDAALVAQLATRPSDGIVTYGELRERLEQVRQADLSVWQSNPRDATFHRWLHPPRAASGG